MESSVPRSLKVPSGFTMPIFEFSFNQMDVTQFEYLRTPFIVN